MCIGWGVFCCEFRIDLPACAARSAAAKSEAKGVAPPRIFVARKAHWFEKFRWFVSSDGLIVVAGSDAQQNEQLVKRCVRGGACYVSGRYH